MVNERISKPDQILKGIGIIIASTIAMAFADAIVKLVSSDLTIWQVFVVRSIFAILCLLAFASSQGIRLMPIAVKWVVARSSLLVLTWLVYYASLPVLSLSVAAVAVYTNPIITALLSAWLLGEKVTGRQWIGVFIGFIGVVIILKPGTEVFSWLILLPLLGAAFYSTAMVLTRSKCFDESATTLAINLHLFFIVSGLGALLVLTAYALDVETIASYPFLLDSWPEMSIGDWGLMAFLGVLSAAFFLGVARAYQIAPPQIIGAFDYSYLVSAVIWSVIFFAETPDALTIFGAILISIAGLTVASQPSNRRSVADSEKSDK